MKRGLFKAMLICFISTLGFSNVFGQTFPIFNDVVQVIPANPSPPDSVRIVYTYKSNDGCPDYFLAKDSVVETRIYVSKKPIPTLGMVCIQVISQFKTILNIGTIDSYTEIYFDGQLIKIIDPTSCKMDKKGQVVTVTKNSSIVQEQNSRDLYQINDVMLPEGTLVQFHGTKIQCFTTPCYNIVDCYEIIESPDCVMDKKGVVVEGKNACAGQLFIQEFSPISSVRQLFLIQPFDYVVQTGDSAVENTVDGFTSIGTNDVGTDSSANVEPCYAGLQEGDKVIFGGYYVKNEMYNPNTVCRYVGIATCYELVEAADNFSLTGQATVDDEILQSGSVILFRKGYRKALNSVPLNSDGKFEFTGLPYGEYTVYVIPDISMYKKYLPTFYINKLRYRRADFVTLNDSLKDLTVILRPYKRPNGNGRIYGNIYFELTTLKDTVMAENGVNKINVQADANIADNLSVILYDTNDEAIDWTVTDRYGNYAFENIALDSYKVVSETAAALGETTVTLSNENAVANADLMLKNIEFNTDTHDYQNKVLNVYPNPVTDMLTITLQEAQHVSVYNTMGQVVLKGQLREGSNALNMSSMDKGIYFFKIGLVKLKVVKE